MRAMNLLLGLSALAALSATSLPARAADPASQLAEAWNGAGIELYSQLAKQPGNLVLSPYSVGAALAMAQQGAAGATSEEMAKTLRLGPDGELGEAAADLAKRIAERAAGDDVELDLAAALHLARHGDLVRQEYRDRMRELFAAEITQGEKVDAVNAWVKEKTGGRIPQILSRLDPRALAVLLTAIRVKAQWAVRFDPEQTAPAPFRLASGESIETPTMRAGGAYRAFADEKLMAIEIPYSAPGFSMVVVTTAEAAAADAEIDAARLPEILRSLAAAEPHRIDLRLPKFAIKSEVDLVDPLIAMGIKAAFDDLRADFSRMANAGGTNNIYISQVRHHAEFEVTEEGAEGSAATAVETSIRSMAKPPRFAVDRPFLFAVVERETGAVLLLGRVADPRPQG